MLYRQSSRSLEPPEEPGFSSRKPQRSQSATVGELSPPGTRPVSPPIDATLLLWLKQHSFEQFERELASSGAQSLEDLLCLDTNELKILTEELNMKIIRRKKFIRAVQETPGYEWPNQHMQVRLGPISASPVSPLSPARPHVSGSFDLAMSHVEKSFVQELKDILVEQKTAMQDLEDEIDKLSECETDCERKLMQVFRHVHSIIESRHRSAVQELRQQVDLQKRLLEKQRNQIGELSATTQSAINECYNALRSHSDLDDIPNRQDLLQTIVSEHRGVIKDVRLSPNIHPGLDIDTDIGDFTHEMDKVGGLLRQLPVQKPKVIVANPVGLGQLLIRWTSSERHMKYIISIRPFHADTSQLPMTSRSASSLSAADSDLTTRQHEDNDWFRYEVEQTPDANGEYSVTIEGLEVSQEYELFVSAKAHADDAWEVPSEISVARVGNNAVVTMTQNTVDVFDVGSGVWEKLIDLDERALRGVSILDCHGDLYLFGGHSEDGQHSDRVHTYNLHSHHHSELSPLQFGRSLASSVMLNEKIIVAGGYRGHSRMALRDSLNSVEEYDFSTAEWTSLAPMMVEREDFAMLVFGKNIVVFGGSNRIHGYLSSVEVYDRQSNEWRVLPDMEVPRSGCSVTVFDGNIVVAGGMPHGRVVEMFDVHERRWIRMPDLNGDHYRPVVGVYRDHLVVAGGVPHFEEYEMFDPKSSRWVALDAHGPSDCAGMIWI